MEVGEREVSIVLMAPMLVLLVGNPRDVAQIVPSIVTIRGMIG